MPKSQPSPEVLALIVASVEAAWPRAVIAGGPKRKDSPSWRFSGRHWNVPTAQGRARPIF